jgi:hypothetical protein
VYLVDTKSIGDNMNIALINIDDISPLAQQMNHAYFISVREWEARELKHGEIPT